MDQGEPGKINNADEMSVIDVVGKIKSATRYLKSKRLTILLVSILGALIGLACSILIKPTYLAVSTFVLEDSKGSGPGGDLSQYAGLASIAGITLGEGGGGIFQGDNIIELYKSRTMIEKALLTSCTFNGKKQLVIDRYIDSYHLRNKWKNDSEKTGDIYFNDNPDNFNRKQDSIITDLVELFNKKRLDVTKPDKKLSIIKVEFVSKDELFSMYFTEKLVQTVNDFYGQTKTKKEALNVQVLQREADSVKAILNSSINRVAFAVDAAPNANPGMSTLKTASQKRQVDVQANAAIYSEIEKNLELAKITLRQQMPLIQVIDKPVLPLRENKITKVKGILIGMVLGLFFAITFLVAKKVITKL
jgi:hypothetical protein